MKRSAPLKRTSPLRAVSPRREAREGRIYATIARGTPMKKRGKKGHRFPHLVNEPFRAWIRSLPCANPSPACGLPVECAHVRSRGAGGADVGNCIPLCGSCHHLQHAVGIKTFQRTYKLDMADLARRLGADYLRATRAGRALHPETEVA